ncbi:nuclear transport factor 2 family protein [Moritella viscosa]|uniref:SnoaL-like domain-containing protein n=1 Tax=Moritella viscosa TaxID=80854 RepID=A0A1L0ARM1_9GAMM|nr:nuclear transport factor 2 family protein [Moritella viscosa]SGZ20337.1 Putative uncharacterized protein [Moritella viscosa]
MNSDIDFIFHQWHERAKAKDITGLLELYSADAIFESPLVPAILKNKTNGILIGKGELKIFFDEGTKRRPNDLFRWYRVNEYVTNGSMLIWEYPRETPKGDQIDILELMEIENGLIKKHRIYWGWKGCSLIAPSLI